MARSPDVAALPPFQRLVDLHARDLRRFLVACVGPVDADDCLQETLVSALRAYPSLRDAGNLRGWLVRIARNKALDHHRRRRELPLAEPPERNGARPPEPPDEELWDAVRALPTKQRAAVACRFVLDYSHAEIASALDCSEAAARRSLADGLANLRRSYTP
jgi:RNA polymerase sigma factor (sigma-70 family)